MKKVLDQYINHILRLASKKPSIARSKGIAYYTAAAECVQSLINAPTPAWVHVRFEKKTY
jgi:hypothetical protein